MEIVIFIIILLFSVILHEVAHGVVAERLGDPTARFAGRLTLNPIPHIDLFGSILLPGFLLFIGSPIIFGAAKPVPVDYRNFRDIRRDMILVSLAGVIVNFAIALVAGIVFRLVPNISDMGEYLLLQTMILNLTLCFFNLLPIPPLDGSKVLASLLGYINHDWMHSFLALEKYGFFILLAVLYTGILQFLIFPPVKYFLEIFVGNGVKLGF